MFVLVVGVIAVALATFGAIRLTSSPVPKRLPISEPLGPGWVPTVARPLPPSASQVSMADASGALGGPVTLPDSAQVSPSDASSVWMASAGSPATGERRVTVAVTFPSKALDVRYSRPAYPDPLANYQNFVKAYPDSKIIYLGRVPALVQTSRRPDGSSWDAVELVRDGTVISVMGSADEPTLQGAAQSIAGRTAP